MACNLITAPTFPQLEDRLLGDLQQSGQRQPLAPQWVVVPSATLANHLRARLAGRSTTGAFAGVRATPLPRLAEQLSRALLGKPLQPWTPILDLTLCELVQRLPARSPLANLNTIRGGATLLRPTFTDLAEGGFGSDDLVKILALADEPDLAPREQAVLRLYADWVRLLQRRQIDWAPLTLQALPERITDATANELARALAAEPGQSVGLFVHGFYEWLDVNLQWLAALAPRVATTIYYPWHGEQSAPHPAFSFTASVLDDLRGRLTGLVETRLAAPATGPGAFFAATFPERTIGDRPEFLTEHRASGLRAEAVAAAARIRDWLDDPRAPVAPADILVVAPPTAEYAVIVPEVFHAFAIPLRASDVPAGPAPADEPLRIIARLWEDQAPAEWVLALLHAAPDTPAATGIDRDAFETKVRDAGIWGGTAWRAAREQPEFTAAERRFIDEILAFVPETGETPTERVTIAAAQAILRRVAERWLSDPRPVAPLLVALAATARHARGLELDLRHWARLLADGAAPRTRRDPLTRAVQLVPVMRARGLTARAVVVLGLAAGELPPRLADDPVLSENASAQLARLARDIGHRLPLKAQMTEEMLLLFFLINTAADRVHWVIPETDAAGKAVAPTPWVQRYLQRWDRSGRARVARSPALQATHLADLDPRTGSYLPPGWALFLDPALAARCDSSATTAFLLEAVARRQHDLAWNGGLGGPPPFARRQVSVTRLEALARCPFRFYAETVAQWAPLEPLALSHALDALTRGTMVHRLLELAVQPHLGKTPVGTIARAMLAADGRALWQLLDQLTASEPALAGALALLPTVFQQAARRDVVRMAIACFQSAQDSGAVPAQTEATFRRPFPGLAGWEIVGKVDRLDRTPAGVELTDFKTGAYPADRYRREVKLGWQIQAALYPWLCGEPATTFRYLFLGKTAAKEGDATGAPAAEQFLSELAPLLQTGLFLPTSQQALEELELPPVNPCRWCRFTSACRRFEPGAAARAARLFAAHAPQRVAACQRALAKPARAPQAT